MIVEIEQAILDTLTDAGFNVSDLDVKDGVMAVRLPAVFVSTEAGAYSKETLSSYRCALSIFVTAVFKHLKSERAQRHGVYPILEGIVNLLLLQNLGLDISAIRPERFRNVTDREMMDNGMCSYQLEFTTSVSVSRVDAAGTFDMLRIALDLYLQEPEDDGEPDASAVVELV